MAADLYADYVIVGEGQELAPGFEYAAVPRDAQPAHRLVEIPGRNLFTQSAQFGRGAGRIMNEKELRARRKRIETPAD